MDYTELWNKATQVWHRDDPDGVARAANTLTSGLLFVASAYLRHLDRRFEWERDHQRKGW